jgi:hypothetical protein
MTIIPESKIQQEIVIYINNNFCLTKHEPRFIVYSVPNGIPIPIPPKERARALDLLHKTGMLNGVSDLIIQGINGRILNVEVKAETDQSPDQVKFQKRVEKLGGYYILVYSLDDFKRKFEQHIKWLKNEN